MTRPMFYRLVGKLVVPCDSLIEMATGFAHSNGWHVKQTEIGDALVSTIFLGVDHNHWAMMQGDDDAPPILFETMILPTDYWDRYQTRCATWEQALDQHNAACVHVLKTRRQLPVVVD